MNQPLPAYPDYKPAGLPWLEQVPAHWEVIANRHIFAERKERGHIEEELLSVTIKQGIIRQSDLIKNSSKKDSSNEDKSKYKLVKPGDFAYNKMRMWQGAVGYSDFRGIVSPAYIVLEPIATIDTRYYHYLMRTPEYVKESYRYSYGICDDQLSLRYEDFRVIKTVLPPLAEQQQMVAFLDTKEQQIARLLRTKRRLIKLLQEQKQALIHRAVTQGLNPNAPRKDSGVAWLDEVPAHWEVLKFKYCVNFMRGGMTPSMATSEYWNGTIPWVSPKDMKQEYISDSELRITSKALAETGLSMIPAGSILAVVRSGILRNTFPLGICTEDVTLNQDMKAFQPKSSICSPQYLYALLKGLEQEVLRQCRKAVATVESIEMPDLASMLLPFPPLDEQQSILNLIDKERSLTNQTISRAQREIELIQEYRTRLVADVVTGRVDVRGLAVASSAAADLGLLDEEEAIEEELLEETAETDG